MTRDELETIVVQKREVEEERREGRSVCRMGKGFRIQSGVQDVLWRDGCLWLTW